MQFCSHRLECNIMRIEEVASSESRVVECNTRKFATFEIGEKWFNFVFSVLMKHRKIIYIFY